jgi:hypothetical protein
LGASSRQDIPGCDDARVNTIETVPDRPNEYGHWPLVMRGGPSVNIVYNLRLEQSAALGMTVGLTPAATGAGYRGENLKPGTVAWADRPLRQEEPPRLSVEGVVSITLSFRRTADYSAEVLDIEAIGTDTEVTAFDRLMETSVFMVYADAARTNSWGWVVSSTDLWYVTGAAPVPSDIHIASHHLL